MEAYINGISYYLPERELGNEELAEAYPEWSVEKISQKTGIYNRHIAAEDEYASDMALKALNKLIAEFDIDKNTIDYLILCTQSPDYSLPTTACIIQDKANLPTACGAIDINLGCSGYIYGLGLAKGLISSGQVKNIVLITSETYSKIIHPKDKSNRTIFGDAAAATFITLQPNTKFNSSIIRNFQYGTDGKGYDKLIVKNSGIKHQKETKEDLLDKDGNFLCNDDFLFMNGREIFNFTAFTIPPLINRILEINSIDTDGVSTFIFHQANAYMLDFVRKRCKIPESKFYVSLKDVGNTVSSTIPIAFCRYIQEKKPVKGDKVLLCGFGVGLSMAGVVVEIN